MAAITIDQGNAQRNDHVLGLFDTATDTLVHLQIEASRDLEIDDPPDEHRYWQALTGSGLAHFLAQHCPGCWGEGRTEIVLEFDDQGGRFLRWWP